MDKHFYSKLKTWAAACLEVPEEEIFDIEDTSHKITGGCPTCGDDFIVSFEVSLTNKRIAQYENNMAFTLYSVIENEPSSDGWFLSRAGWSDED